MLYDGAVGAAGCWLLVLALWRGALRSTAAAATALVVDAVWGLMPVAIYLPRGALACGLVIGSGDPAATNDKEQTQTGRMSWCGDRWQCDGRTSCYVGAIR